ncbi:ATP-dependent Clp protease adaptor ClpS [Aureibacter tunicatorum]|uniref:ATP-dependent Clp protease adaptor protein ClpS n=1 Tax=Aureibacter tunicatorum TaxID=866807 RepID=A0AAE3XL45_9BACT|nr:ATP-dependent Clp protease adaptor ClpS [Aureibacter tunicatorum]MDR6237766.1 ATP-dependent Clp protease adaptor protein ClpS [Aureibacter tunicatorum]BDD02801.1 ATP-dependent Clp protease adaptor protein ClpS [Aureibacter tunicatorum]
MDQIQEDELIEVLEEIKLDDLLEDNHDLMVYNDDVNTFDHVISMLIKICKHHKEQAEQCTWIIHYKGKCSVKKGSKKDLKPMKDALCESGIDAKIL